MDAIKPRLVTPYEMAKLNGYMMDYAEKHGYHIGSMKLIMEDCEMEHTLYKDGAKAGSFTHGYLGDPVDDLECFKAAFNEVFG